MKKILVILLILAMVLPFGMPVQAAEEVGIQPFYLITQGRVLEEQTSTYDLPFFWTNKPYVEKDLLNSVWYGKANSYSIPDLARALKEEFDKRPDGTRFINYTLGSVAMRYHTTDVVFVEKGVELSQTWLEAFLAEYSRIGGKLDGLDIDVELEDLYATYIHSRYAVNDPLVYKRIVDNPVYQEKIRPALVERGFKFYENVTDNTPEIYSIHPNVRDQYPGCMGIWDAVLRSYVNTMATEACAPLWKYYPEATMSDYQSKNIKAWLKELNDFGGLNAAGGNYVKAGTASNENYYSCRPYSFFTTETGVPKFTQIPGMNKAYLEDRPFNYFLYEANLFKNTYLAADDGQVIFWIGHYLYNIKNENSASLTPYYVEQLYHMAMLTNVENPNLFGYIVETEIGNAKDYEFCVSMVDDVVKDLTRVLGAADRKPINVATSWNNSFVISGMNAGGKNIWRITPDTALVSVEDFKIEGSDPTFYINGETITFPQGKIIEEGSVRGWDEDRNVINNNTCGYWVETPANVTPVVTRSADYHRVNPTYGEDYESYEIGTEYNYKNALPISCWEVKKSGTSSATIVADPTNANNKVLELKGNYTFKNVNMPKNITAGDTYAENQAWEVEVTIPSDMAADAEVTLLYASNDKKKVLDGGFKIAGNKIYYSDNGQYVELADVTVTPGSKYRLVRNMDFNDAENLVCDYLVYDASGNLLGRAKKAVVAGVNLPVEGVSLGCTGITGQGLLLDNFKLYPTKVGMDFELYDENTGILVENVETARDRNTAYRLSWLNSYNTEKTYTVMAAYYQGDQLIEEKVIEEVKMAANFEGVAYGVVPVAEGQSVRVYLRNDNPAEEDDDIINNGNEKPGDTQINTGNDQNNIVLILIIAFAAIIVVCTVVVVLLLAGKKKASAQKTPAQENEPQQEDQ